MAAQFIALSNSKDVKETITSISTMHVLDGSQPGMNPG
jgi:hypothetical protein